ncbi:hypothetical protein CFP65_5871 [Kitasatospora sp. MMS16-BH015]|uniref:hypothetical protein n=1 Tax=Kitasatospora sp. MMS16-BH015 TaxID=2018025 RepID=UPI000CA253B5|nr:hypothetical protein [Kitasatospora sp. MMS16-BH015]AUG80552.1 hypothetical protein CFP65_5871 [Kitasatospora sp. MMS16-BH015]
MTAIDDTTHAQLVRRAFPPSLGAALDPLLGLGSLAIHPPSGSVTVRVDGIELTLPQRTHALEPPTDLLARLAPTERLVVACWYSRHGDGHLRQWHLRELLASAEPWVVPYVVELAGDYVLEILLDLRTGLAGLPESGDPRRAVYGRWLAENPAHCATVERRVVSYWSCYHRHRAREFADHPGAAVLELLRAAAEAETGRRRPSQAPRARRGRRPGVG